LGGMSAHALQPERRDQDQEVGPTGSPLAPVVSGRRKAYAFLVKVGVWVILTVALVLVWVPAGASTNGPTAASPRADPLQELHQLQQALPARRRKLTASDKTSGTPGDELQAEYGIYNHGDAMEPWP
jgi:hypothetical protein